MPIATPTRNAALPALTALLLIFTASTPLISQSDTPPPAPITPTLSLGDPTRSVTLESDDPETTYQGGLFITANWRGQVRIRAKDGHIASDLNLSPLETQKFLSPAMHDVAVFKDGSIVASWVYLLPHDSRRYFYLIHYDPAGKSLEQIDLGKWRALKLCIAEDRSIWTLSGEEELGHPIYSPDEGVLRNYKFGSGLVRDVVPRATFPQDNNNAYSVGRTAIDCSGGKIHVLTGDSHWIEYTPGSDFTITPIEPFSHATFGDYWQMVGFACLHDGHAYAVIHSVPGDPFRRYLAELLPTKDGKSLQWVEVPDKTLPANNHPTNPTIAPTTDTTTPPADTPKEPIAVTAVLGADHADGEQLVYRTSANDSILISKPSFASPTPP
jgi:hypothetical protein